MIIERLRRHQMLMQVGTVTFALLAMADGALALASADRPVTFVGELASGLAVAGSALVLTYERRASNVPPPPAAPLRG